MKKLYVIWDDVAGNGSDLLAFVNDGVAVRYFRDFLRTLDKSNRKDFSLMYCGNYDSSTLVFTTNSTEVVIATGKDFADEV